MILELFVLELILAALFAFSPANAAIPTNIADRPVGGPFTSVTEHYGPLVVQTGTFEIASGVKPWSSWWYPLNDDYLFQSKNNQKSPLERYDAYVKKTGRPDPDSANFERTQLYQPHAVPWAGLCDAWAIASISSPEPTQPLRTRGIDFRVGDLKALLLKTYEAVDGLQTFGQRYEGKWDSVYEDIYPDQLHKFMQAELFEQGRPFIMDYDPGIEVWNTPVWRAKTTIVADASDPSIVHVDTWLFTASADVNFDFVGTEEIVREYTYDLYGTPRSDGSFLVSAGAWTNRSQWDHPDDVIAKPENITRKSWNKQIDVSMVDDILGGR